MNDKKRLLLLLQIIRINGNTAYLLRYDYTLAELSATIDSLRQNGFVQVSKHGISLSDKGERLFHSLNKSLGRRGLYKYFNIDNAKKNEPLPLDAVYVPYKRVDRS